MTATDFSPSPNPATSWKQRVWAYVELTRLNRPVGIELLLWPTLWALWLAGRGHPDPGIVLLFVAGVVLMRSAGCAINDYADRHVDGQVARTCNRPLARGVISGDEALGVFAVLVLCSAALLWWLPIQVFYWSFGALFLAGIYPFMKRWTYLPQFVLGAAFSWAIPMAYVALGRYPGLECWLLYVANLCWTVAYDTQYAMVDRNDDVNAGIKSTALLFGRFDVLVIVWLQALFLLFFWAALLWAQGMHPTVYGDQLWLLLVLALCFVWQWRGTRTREREACFQAFLHNRWVGRLGWVGVVLLYGLAADWAPGWWSLG